MGHAKNGGTDVVAPEKFSQGRGICLRGIASVLLCGDLVFASDQLGLIATLGPLISTIVPDVRSAALSFSALRDRSARTGSVQPPTTVSSRAAPEPQGEPQ